MDPLRSEIAREYLSIGQDAHTLEVVDSSREATRLLSPLFLDKLCEVVHLLQEEPYLPGQLVSQRCGLDRALLGSIYEMIQRSDACRRSFLASRNRDYFNVVAHYFDRRMYTLVFFVGNTCPSRCVYCPNVTTDARGRRRIATYGSAEPSSLHEDVFVEVFQDLVRMREDPSDLLVKISGGLEPLTDVATVSTILRCAEKHQIRVKLFTNGLLLSDPCTRMTALQSSDVRISLSTPDEAEYQNLCFSDVDDAMADALSNLKRNIANLVEERKRGHGHCKIGINSIVVPSNHTKLIRLLEMARQLGIDYVDFKPDYFSSYPPDVITAMERSTSEARERVAQGSFEGLSVNFTCSLFRDDLYWREWDATCEASKQSKFKLFVTPFGDCSPIHFGAFPRPSDSPSDAHPSFFLGKLGSDRGLLDLLHEPAEIPAIEMKKLNPFELMLSLEIEREEQDAAWGLPPTLNPYRRTGSYGTHNGHRSGRPRPG